MSLSFSLSLSPSNLSICLSISSLLYRPTLYSSQNWDPSLSFSLSLSLSIYLSIYLYLLIQTYAILQPKLGPFSLFLSISLSVYLSIYLSLPSYTDLGYNPAKTETLQTKRFATLLSLPLWFIINFLS